jgi:methyltransferase family protein
VGRHVARRAGLVVGRSSRYRLVPRTAYSPVPDPAELRADLWAQPRSLHWIEWDLEAQLAWAERELPAYIAEFARPPDVADGFHYENAYYEQVDADLTYAIVRHLRPRRVLELGTGYSTLVLARACRANARDGATAELHTVDPGSAVSVPDDLPGLTSKRTLPAQELPLEEFLALDAGDVLLVDTSHTVKIGGEVVHIVLDVLPRLAPGVWVHFHDIWLPWEYHPELVLGMEMYWSEQYLLQAFLAGSHGYEVRFATQAIAREMPERLERLVPSYRARNYPSSFWIRRSSTGP